MEEEKKWILDLPLTKQGNSLAISIPKRVLDGLGLVKGDKVRVILYNKNEE